MAFRVNQVKPLGGNEVFGVAHSQNLLVIFEEKFFVVEIISHYVDIINNTIILCNLETGI